MIALFLASVLSVPPPSFEAYCFDCHGDGMAKGDLAIDEVLPAMNVDDAGYWIALRSRLHHRDMPPEGKPRPTEAEYEAMQAWVGERIAELADNAASPGRVGPRRLNNVEYALSIRDLFGVSFDVTERFPADGVGEGFDTTADVLSLPPLLLEKYFDAAEQVARDAVHDEGNPGWAEHRVEAAAMQTRGRVTQRSGVQWMPSRAAAGSAFTLPRPGKYLVRVGAFGQQAGSEPVKLELRVNEQARDVLEVPATRSNPGTYERSLDLPGDLVAIEVVFVNDYYKPDHPDPSQRDRNAGVQWISVVGPIDEVEPTDFQRSLPLPGEGEDVDAHLRRVIAELLPRTWRRPVMDSEVERLVDLSRTTCGADAPLEPRLRTCITAMLVSPSFLLRVDREPPGSEPHSLSGHELATRLSYFLWSTTPDDELLAAAASGALGTSRGRREQVRRMLDDPRSRAIAEHFATQWLQVRSLPMRTPDPRRFPAVDPALLQSMQEETITLFDVVLRENRPAWDLLAADFTHVDEPLSQHYGMEWPEGAEGMQRIAIDASRPRGIFGHASILTATSNPTRTSPVKRGKWVLEALLDDPPPPPPPGIDALPEAEGVEPNLGLRDLMALHTTDPACRSCHARMDPLGLAMESMDAVGRQRDAESIAALDLEAVLPGGRSFTGVQGLQELLIGDRAFLRALARHMLVYALGRGTTFEDEALLLYLADQLEEDPTLNRLIIEIVESDAFLQRAPLEADGA